MSGDGSREADSPSRGVTTRHIALALVESAEGVLIGVRPEGVPLAGYWEFPGGKVQPGENPAAAAVRECREETGLAVEVVAELPVTEHEYDYGRLKFSSFRCRALPGSPPPLPPFRWVAVHTLGEYRFPPANAGIVAVLLAKCRHAT